jgi:Tol biopolymer transport system component
VLYTDEGGLTGLAWWKGGNALMFIKRTSATGPFGVAALDLATLNVRRLTDPPAAPDMGTHGDLLPAISPDERTLAFVRETREGRDVFLLDLVTNVERRLTRDHQRISGLTWSSDGQAVIMSSARGGIEALYRVALTDGAIERVPNTSDGATSPMAGPGGLVFSQEHDDSNIYRVDLRNGRTLGLARPIIASSRSDTAMDISADGRNIAFLSTRSGGPDVWVASADGTSPRRLTSLSVTSGPRWSPDGRWIAFGAMPAGHARPDVWLVDANGGTPRRLDDNPSYDTALAWTADSTSVYFRSDRSGLWQIWKVPIQGGVAVQVTYNVGLNAEESRDGNFLFYANDVPEVWRRSLRGSSPEQLMIRLPPGTHWGGNWRVGARGLYYIRSEPPGVEGIDFLPFGPAAGPPVRIVSLAAPVAHAVSVLAVAPDDSWLVWTQADYRNSDIMMIAPRQ